MSRKEQKSQFSKLADHVATQAMLQDTPFVDKISALKALTDFYKVVHGKSLDTDEADDTPSMSALSAHIHQFSENANGATGAPVRSRRTS